MKRLRLVVRLIILPLVLLTGIVAYGSGTTRAEAHAVASACPAVDYPTFGFDQGRSSNNSSECVINPSTIPAFNWVASFASSTLGAREGISTLGKEGFIGLANKLIAIDLPTGAVIWSFPTGAPISGAATTFLGNVYFGSQDSKFYALTASGSLICAISLGAPITTTPVGYLNTVIVSASNGRVYGLNASTCAPIWATSSLGLTITSPSVFKNQAYVSVQVSSSQSVVFALNASTGAVLGTTPAVPGTFTPPVVEFGRIYVGDSNPSPSILAFNAIAPYSVLWTATTSGVGVFGKPAVDQGQLYAVGGNGTLYAFNASTGAFAWSSVGPCGPLYKAASPTLANTGVYAGGSSCVQAFKTIGGGATWTVSVGGLVTSPATIVNGALYVTTTTGSGDSIFSY